MNRQTTIILAVAAIILAGIVLISEQVKPSKNKLPGVQNHRILNLQQSDIQRLSVKRDYWNSFTLTRNPDSSWKLIDPANEPANAPAVEKLLQNLENLPIQSTIDLPMNDTERYKEYGLWEPSEQITLTTNEKEYTLLFGAETKDKNGVYCAVQGQDNVYVTSSAAFSVVSMDLEAYRTAVTPVTPTIK